jgi:hypothetical protein
VSRIPVVNVPTKNEVALRLAGAQIERHIIVTRH